MFDIGYEFKNAKDEVLATVINVVSRGFSHGFYTQDSEVKVYFPLYVVKRKSTKHGWTIVTITENVLAGKERWTEMDSVNQK